MEDQIRKLLEDLSNSGASPEFQEQLAKGLAPFVTKPRVMARNWPPVVNALEYAYPKLGREKNENGYDTYDWNLAVHVYEYAILEGPTCLHCQKKLAVFEVIRCLDCKAQMCESCAKSHFGPDHYTRAAAAHAVPSVEEIAQQIRFCNGANATTLAENLFSFLTKRAAK